MKKIKLNGLEYGEEEIKALKEYNKFRLEKANEIFTETNGDLIRFVLKMAEAKDNYMKEINAEDVRYVKEFARAEIKTKDTNPVLSSLLCVVLVVFSCVLPNMLSRITMSAITAGFIFTTIENIKEKIAFKKLNKLVKE